MKNKNILISILFLLGICFYVFAFLRIKDQILIVDEGNHFDQIMRFVHADTQFNQILMTVPGYHFIMAVIVKTLGLSELWSVRLIAFLLNILIFPVYYLCVKRFGDSNAPIKTIQLAFFPILFPFFFLIYTDIFSLLLILLAFFFVLDKRYYLSGIAIGFSLFVRQNNLIWLIFFNFVLYIRMFGLPPQKKYFITHIKKSVFYITSVLILGLYFIYTGGLVVSGYAKSYVHISWSLFGNVYFCLFVAFFMFLPRQIASFFKVTKLFVQKKWLLPAIVLFYFFYNATFVNDNPFNHSTWFLHNLSLEFFTRDIFSRILFFIIITYSILSIAVSPLRYRWANLIYPFTVIYLLPYWLIEQRYYFIPLILFFLLSKPMKRQIEYIQFAWWVFLSIYFFEGIVTLRFFL